MLAQKVEELVTKDGLTDERLDSIERSQARFFDLLQGPPLEQLDGTVTRNTDEGIVHKVDYMYDKLANGGVTAKLPLVAWVPIIVAIVGGIAVVVGDLIMRT